jgi:hypothetical protein
LLIITHVSPFPIVFDDYYCALPASFRSEECSIIINPNYIMT